jgi:hypothetical protein
MPLSPGSEILINTMLAALFAYIKAQGKSEEEAKALMEAKVAQIETLKDLPVD